eukprot:CAMPEP_0205919152 /NCGR_PEP_ID=MMETSP1325-20131115/10263_1 /ASSEMBLY_ACC=CAM_ASM_000708 /TAXON_ID=236786 /ORGANISM="Florenciella sp., Strain RCC1007" /LENGTH=75 /DNA_ID=CAMNT_0053286739 /DNA_START=116 /DNA_END=343 /DNA_ORIENTATION=-
MKGAEVDLSGVQITNGGTGGARSHMRGPISLVSPYVASVVLRVRLSSSAHRQEKLRHSPSIPSTDSRRSQVPNMW